MNNDTYYLDTVTKVWSRPSYSSISYSDGDEVECRIAEVIRKVCDLTVLSSELIQHCTDWPSLYHLSSTRANILRPFYSLVKGKDVLEIGAGCGAITRYLGESEANVLALEGSIRRAAIARSRTRDMSNVDVLADRFDNFQTDQKFDVITLIGVLEYANLFTDGEQPALTMLKRVRSLLRPNGRLIIAIENQFGLKYFAGAPEDHLGEPMYGIEGRYRHDQPQTFGRKVLADILKLSDFVESEFLAPFPDYKFATSIVTEDGFAFEGFDAAALAWQSVKRDPQLPAHLAFSPELVWRGLVNNGIALDMANSFLIVANTSPQQQNINPILAYHYSTERDAKFCKATVFEKTGTDSVEVIYRSLAMDEVRKVEGLLVQFSFPEKDQYILGTPLSFELIDIVTRDGWSIEEVGTFMHRYLGIVKERVFPADQSLKLDCADTPLPGFCFDLVPQNIIISSDGKWHVIDKEWVVVHGVNVGWLVFRTLMLLLNSVTRFGQPKGKLPQTRIGFFSEIFQTIGLNSSPLYFDSIAKIEASVQSEVCGRPIDAYLDWHPQAAINLRKSHNQIISDLDNEIAICNQAISDLNFEIANINRIVEERDRKIKSLLLSKSWVITKPLRFLSRILRGRFNETPLSFSRIHNIRKIALRARNAARYLIRADFDGLFKRLRAYKQNEYSANSQPASSKPLNQQHWAVVATKHTLFIAYLIADRLRAHEVNVDVMTDFSPSFSHDYYVVICPQMFGKLPPGNQRIVFQMEQSVSSRWFTKNYINLLNSSLAVLDYALTNIDFLSTKYISYPQVNYIPIGASTHYGISIPYVDKTCDVLFYGDSKSSQRRVLMLDALKKRFDVQVVNEVFGHDMIKAIKQARVVINLHYYEDALLEMPRIQECLSLGVPVVSESAQDQNDYPELVGSVRFFDQGSIPAMLEAVDGALKNPVPTETINMSVLNSVRRFEFMFDRFLVGAGFLPATHVNDMYLPIPDSVNRLILSMPETIARRRIFEAERPQNCAVFDGIRKTPGWIGCGLSYMALAQHAIKHGKNFLNVMEDDVLLPSDFEIKVAAVHEFLDARPGEWDIFAGVIASLHPEVKILSVEIFKGITFVTINKMTSMVFNIYNEKALHLLASWNSANHDAQSNTIDRYIESQANLRVVITLPFFVGHREELNSTLWGFKNTQYRDMIIKSENTIQEMVQSYKDMQLYRSS